MADDEAYRLEETETYSGVLAHQIVRTSDDTVLGDDDFYDCPEDATFTRGLSWVLDELNRAARRGE